MPETDRGQIWNSPETSMADGSLSIGYCIRSCRSQVVGRIPNSPFATRNPQFPGSFHLPGNCDRHHNEAGAERTMKTFAVDFSFGSLPKWIWISRKTQPYGNFAV
jgi:hypothetical protein